MKNTTHFFLILLLSLLFSCEKNEEPTVETKQTALLIAVVDDSNISGDRLQHVIKYNFNNGELLGSDTLLSNPGGHLHFDSHTQIHKNRYLITESVKIFDLNTNSFLYEGGEGSEYTRLLDVIGNNVYFKRRNSDEYFYFDLQNEIIIPLSSPNRWSLPGLASPNGSMSVSSENHNGGLIWLHQLNGDISLLAEGYWIEYSMLSPSYAGVPLLWIDNQRILSQKTNGEIVIINIDGNVEPVTNIALDEAIPTPSDPNGCLLASLYFHNDGTIKYFISLLSGRKFQSYIFTLDITNKSYAQYDPEWIDLGYDFDYTPKEEPYIVRHQGYEIGEQGLLYSNYVRTTDGYIAFPNHKDIFYPKSVRVWGQASESWTTINFESPSWIVHDAVIGWVN